MGLDQYAHKSKGGKSEQIAYWRKHNRLQGWMELLYFSRNPNAIEFNCQPMTLSATDLDKLEQDMVNRKLPITRGFFYGSDSYNEYDEHYREDDEAFIKEARLALANGCRVKYHCWY